MDVEDAAARLRTRSQWEHDGVSSRQLTERVRRGRLHRVDHGWYVDAEEWRARYSEERHLMRVVAAAGRRAGESSLVFSHFSAAVLWGLPLARVEPRRVHVSGATAGGHVDAGDPAVARHEVAVATGDVATVQGLPCTSLARTVADVLRVATEETGIAVMDAALRRVAWVDRGARYDAVEAERFVGQVAARLPRGGRGVRRARYVLALGDGRAQLPGESISRLYLLRLGFASPRLQVAVPAPHGRHYFVDFGLDDADVWGEFDGRAKYVDAGLRAGGVDIESVVLAEKEREDWIRGTTGRRIVRWSTAHIVDEAALRTRLAAFGVRPR